MRFVCRFLRYFKESQGFSLIEMAIVLAIMGVIAGLSLPALTYFQGFEKDKTTKRRQDMVLHALGSYAANQGRLPYAASHQGEEVANHLNGSVPYRTLGLSFEDTMDGWGHPMKYIVESSLAGDQSYCQIKEPKYPLKLDDGQGLVGGNSFVAVILIAEGKAFGQPRGIYEENNHKGNQKFYTRAFKDTQETPFRHRLVWSTRDNLLNYYGHSTCPKKEASVVRLADQDLPMHGPIAQPDPVHTPSYSSHPPSHTTILKPATHRPSPTFTQPAHQTPFPYLTPQSAWDNW